MPKFYTGIDIGVCAIKFSEVSGNKLLRCVSEPLPDNLVRDDRVTSPEAMSQFIRETAKKYRLRHKHCTVVLPSSQVFTRRITEPYMTVEHLRLNLPYEFRDFITRDKEQYFYDYAVVGVKTDKNGNPTSLDLMIAAVLKETVALYSDMFRRAGFRLVAAMPVEFAYRNIINLRENNEPVKVKLPTKVSADKQTPENPSGFVFGGAKAETPELNTSVADNAAQPDGTAPDANTDAKGQPAAEIKMPTEYCLIDFGHNATRIYMYAGGALEAAKVISFGGAALDMAISQAKGVDRHIAHSYKLSNYEEVLDLPQSAEVYSQIALEASRTINFYNFNNPDNHLTDVYFFGGGSRIKQLTESVAEALNLKVHNLYELFPTDFRSAGELLLSPASYGTTIF